MWWPEQRDEGYQNRKVAATAFIIGTVLFVILFVGVIAWVYGRV